MTWCNFISPRNNPERDVMSYVIFPEHVTVNDDSIKVSGIIVISMKNSLSALGISWWIH